MSEIIPSVVRRFEDAWQTGLPQLEAFLPPGPLNTTALQHLAQDLVLIDLEQRGMLKDTLVVWSGEFGRLPTIEAKNSKPGRDHNPYGFSMWMAGAGIHGGRALVATDEFGLRAVEQPKTIHDVNATILRLMGVDHTKLVWRYQSRDMRLTDVHGEIVQPVLA